MSVIYSTIFIIGALELLLLLAILLPLPLFIRNSLYGILNAIIKNFAYGLGIIFALITFMFIDSLGKVLHANHPVPTIVPTSFDPYSHCKVFYAQRNMYLTFLTLIMGFVLFRLPQITQITQITSITETTPVTKFVIQNENVIVNKSNNLEEKKN